MVQKSFFSSLRSQQSMEGLMIIGWIVIIAIVALGLLNYLGIFNPGKFIPDTCLLTTGMVCNGALASSTDNKITLSVHNNLDDELIINDLNVSETDCAPSVTGFVIAKGSSQNIELSCSGLSSKKRLNSEITGSYKKGNSGLDHRLNGKLVLDVE